MRSGDRAALLVFAVSLLVLCGQSKGLRRTDRLWPDRLLGSPAPPVTPRAQGVTGGVGLLGGPRALVAFTLLRSWMWWRRGHRDVASLRALSVLGVIPPSLLLKAVVARPRPNGGHAVPRVVQYGFPSLHAAVSAAFGAVMVSGGRSWSRRRLVVLGVPLLVGVSRVMAGEHYLSSVLAGWLLGVAWALALDQLPLIARSGNTAVAGEASRPGESARGGGIQCRVFLVRFRAPVPLPAPYPCSLVVEGARRVPGAAQ